LTDYWCSQIAAAVREAQRSECLVYLAH
jgi:hypothetical protein